MDTCPYYCELPAPDLRSAPIPCCKHKHSPVKCTSPSLRSEWPFVLRCHGHVSTCQIPAQLQFDIAQSE